MGACISKCRSPRSPGHKHKGESLLVQDKLVISQVDPTSSPDIPLPNKQSNSLLSSPSDSCTSNITSTSICSTSTLSSLSSTCSSSAALVSKIDRSFSNEFLWARLKENPHVIIPHGLESLKESPVKVAADPKFPTRKLDSSSKSSAVKPSQAGRIGLPPKKRGRDSSPTLAGQRSVKKEFERTQSTSSLPGRNFGYSPSPSRKFSGEPCRGIPINSPKRCNSAKIRSCDGDVGLKNNGVKSISSTARKENLQPRNPLNKIGRDGSQILVRKRETRTHHIQDGIDDQDSVGAMMCDKDSNSLPLDDLNNPLISLDCFIFL